MGRKNEKALKQEENHHLLIVVKQKCYLCSVKRANSISYIDCVMPLTNRWWHCSEHCEATKKSTHFPDYVFVDRIDLQIEVTTLPFEKMADNRPGESSATIRERVIRARQIQEERYSNIPGIYCNAQMNSKLLALYARPDDKGLTLLKNAMNRLNLSARAYDRILKVSRTIADLEGCQSIQTIHLAEAIGIQEFR